MFCTNVLVRAYVLVGTNVHGGANVLVRPNVLSDFVSIFTMKSCTFILICFVRIGLFCLHEKFQISQSSSSGFLSKNATSFIIFAEKKNLLVNYSQFYISQQKLSDFDHNWPKTRRLLFSIPISTAWAIVQWIVCQPGFLVSEEQEEEVESPILGGVRMIISALSISNFF